MKTLYIECRMGAAGDMLSAALAELLPDKEAFVDELNSLGIPGIEYKLESSVKCGITGSHMKVTWEGKEEGEEHHEHHHEHSHHHHSGMHDIEHIVRDHINVPDKVKEDILAVYGLIAEAESHAHNRPVEEIHFHEVGTMDAVADVTAVCLLMYKLNPDRVVVSPVHVGSGQVRCVHGILPVPAPATAYILRNVPIYGGSVDGELCTPTGAALLKYFADDFAQMPVMRTEAVGYGMGKKDFTAANCVRAFLGESLDGGDTVTELNCNVDDMTAEEIGFAVNALFEAGALEVYTTAVGMKKSRPGTLITLLCRDEDKGKFAELIFKYTSTIGIREASYRRYKLERSVETVKTELGEVRRKVSGGYGVTREKFEYDDLAEIAAKHGMSMDEVRRIVSETVS